MSSRNTSATNTGSKNEETETNEKDLTATTTKELPKIILPKKYMTTSMPTRGAYHSEKILLYHTYQDDKGYFINSDENLLISQPLPDTVKIVNEKPNIGKKDSCWLGCFMACLLCFAVKERT